MVLLVVRIFSLKKKMMSLMSRKKLFSHLIILLIFIPNLNQKFHLLLLFLPSSVVAATSSLVISFTADNIAKEDELIDLLKILQNSLLLDKT
jgi:hypothetical protein